MLDLSPRALRILAAGARAFSGYGRDAEDRHTAKVLAVALTAHADAGPAVLEGVGPLPVDVGADPAAERWQRWVETLEHFGEGDADVR